MPVYFIFFYLSQVRFCDSGLYNEFITHETLRVAVCGMVENECALNMPQQFKNIIEQSFLNFYEHYVEIATKYQNRSGSTIKVINYNL